MASVVFTPKLDPSLFPSSYVWKPEWVRDANWSPPKEAISSRPKSSQRDGLKYENTIGKILVLQKRAFPEAEYKFQLSLRGPEGVGILDHLLLFPSFGVIFETKLSLKAAGIEQVRRYGGLAGAFYQRPFFLVLICKSLTATANGMTQVESIGEVVTHHSEGPLLWHISWPERVLKTHLENEVASLPLPDDL